VQESDHLPKKGGGGGEGETPTPKKEGTLLTAKTPNQEVFDQGGNLPAAAKGNALTKNKNQTTRERTQETKPHVGVAGQRGGKEGVSLQGKTSWRKEIPPCPRRGKSGAQVAFYGPFEKNF